MSVFKSKTITITILTLYSLYTNSLLTYLCALILIILPRSTPIIINTLIAIVGLLIHVVNGDIIAIVLTVAVVAVHLYYFGRNYRNV